MPTAKSTTWFPLLDKELIELANRKRTYVIRFLYAAALFGCGMVILYGRGGVSTDSSARLGEGYQMFQRLVWLQFMGIYLFLPAMTAGALTSEKERDTLTLLLLTPMKPWMILIQKLLSRVIPMLCFVMLSFPLLAVAYSYGGVTTASLFQSMWWLSLTVFQVAALSLMCSAYCRTSVEAFLASYVLLVLSQICVAYCLSINTFGGTRSLDLMIPQTIFMVGITVVYMLLARMFLVTRAFVPPRNVLLQVFKALDQMFQDMNSVTGGIVLVKDKGQYPDNNPVAWRESTKKSLGTARYLFRVLVLLEVPILVVAQSITINAFQSQSGLSTLAYILWCIALTMIGIHAAGVITSERSRQTLDSLLTVPISGRDLILQKLAGVRRLMWVLFIPFLTIVWAHHGLRDYRNDYAYMLLSLGYVLVLMRLACWTAFWIGLKIRSQMKAVFTTLAVLATWALLPPLLGVLTRSWGLKMPAWWEWMLALSPATVILELENWYLFLQNHTTNEIWVRTIVLTVVLALYGLLTWAIRMHCLRHADELLGRVPAERPVENTLPQLADAVSPAV